MFMALKHYFTDPNDQHMALRRFLRVHADWERLQLEVFISTHTHPGQAKRDSSSSRMLYFLLACPRCYPKKGFEGDYCTNNHRGFDCFSVEVQVEEMLMDVVDGEVKKRMLKGG